MQLSELQDFFLVGGTALALQLGHRISVDIDLFTQKDFDTNELFNNLNSKFVIADKSEGTNTLNFTILFPEQTDNMVKVYLIKYPYALIQPIIEYDGLRLLSIEDIIPMKLSAVAGRGSKKDFYDIFYLLQKYSFAQMFVFLEQKFKNTNTFHVLKSLTYFEDAEIEPNPVTIGNADWDEIKRTITHEANVYLSR